MASCGSLQEIISQSLNKFLDEKDILGKQNEYILNIEIVEDTQKNINDIKIKIVYFNDLLFIVKLVYPNSIKEVYIKNIEALMIFIENILNQINYNINKTLFFIYINHKNKKLNKNYIINYFNNKHINSLCLDQNIIKILKINMNIYNDFISNMDPIKINFKFIDNKNQILNKINKGIILIKSLIFINKIL